MFIRSKAIIPMWDEGMKNLRFIIANDEEDDSDRKNRSDKQLRNGEEFIFYDDGGKTKNKDFIKYKIKTEMEDESMMSIKF